MIFGQMNHCSSRFLLIFILFAFSSSVSAQTNISKLISKLKTADDDSSRIEAYASICEYYQYTHPDSSYYYLQIGLKKFVASNYLMGIGSIINLIGVQDANQGNIDLAFKRQKEALAIFEEISYKKGIGIINNSLGILEGRKGNYDSAATHFIAALKVYNEIGYTKGIILTYINLGNINENINNPNKALEYDNKALDMIKDTNEVYNRCILYNNMAIIYGKKGNLKLSLEYLQKALDKSDTGENLASYVYSLLNMGIVYSKFGDLDKALKMLNQVLLIAKEKGMTEEYAKILINIASITGEKEPKKAILQMEEALVIAKKMGNKSMLEDIYLSLIEFNKQTGNYNKVASLLEDLMKYQDSTSGIEKTKAIANLQSVYELEQSNNKIKELKLEEQAHELKKNVLIFVVICLGFTILFILLYVRKVNHLNLRLSLQEKQLKEANATKDRLFSIIGHDLRSPIGNITMILELLEAETQSKVDEEILNTLQVQAVASLETLDKLLSWGKSQMEGERVVNEIFKPIDFIETNIRLLKINANRKHINVCNNVNPSLAIKGDKSHFDFIIRNLLSNAIKFTRTGGHLEIGSDENLKKGYVIYFIKDDGIGIQKEKLSQIFVPFINNTEGTEKEPGTGIGLMLCKEFVLENKGEIWVESRENEGTTFYFSFPIA